MGSNYTYAMRLVTPFVRLLRTYDSVPDEILEPLAALDPDERVPVDVLHELLRGALVLTGDSALGLKAAREIEVGDYGALEYAASTAAGHREALILIARYIRLVNDALTVSIEVEPPQTTIRLHSAIDLPPVAEDYELAAFYVTMDAHTPQETFPFSVHFMHDPPAELSAYRTIFSERAELHFGAPFTGFRAAAEHFDGRPPGPDPKLHAVIRSHAEHLLSELPDPANFSERARAHLTMKLLGTSATLAGTARALRVSERTLSRRLEQEGTSFKELLDDVRRQLALRYVGASDLPFSEVAFLLGFSQVSAFHRAFKRWADMTPLGYRNRKQGRQAG